MKKIAMLVVLAGLCGIAEAEPPLFVERPGELEFSGQLIVRPRQDLSATGSNDRGAALLAEQAPEPAAQGARGSSLDRYAPDSILVRFDAGAAAPRGQRALELIGGVVRREFVIVPGLACVGVTIPVEEALALLDGFPGVLYAEPNAYVQLTTIPNDPDFGSLWGLHNTGQTGVPDADIDAPEAWDLFTGDPNMVVAVIDSGMNYLHPDLAANAWVNPGEIPGNGIDDDANGYVDDVRGWDFWNNDADPMDDHGHGSFCAGIIGAVGNNGVGITGVNWRCKIMPVKFISAGGTATLEGALGAIDYAITNGARISSHSWISLYTQALQDAVDAAQSVGHLMVAASGNFGTDNDITPYYPAAFANDNIIAVGGLHPSDTMAGFSNYGPVSVDLIAPAVNVKSCGIAGYVFGSGTSAAAPHAAGAATLILARHPTMIYTQVRARIFRGVRSLPGLEGKVATGGVLNVATALAYCLADFNLDGFVNGDDYDVFAELFDIADPGADFNGDGFVNGDDYDAFASAFDGGC